jgi:hypothetical protein
VEQLVEALRTPEDSGFGSSWCHGNISWQSFRLHYGPGVDSTSNRNEYQECLLGGKGGRGVGLTTFPPSCIDCLEIGGLQTPGTLGACNRPVQDLFYPLLYKYTESCFNLHSITAE